MLAVFEPCERRGRRCMKCGDRALVCIAETCGQGHERVMLYEFHALNTVRESKSRRIRLSRQEGNSAVLLDLTES